MSDVGFKLNTVIQINKIFKKNLFSIKEFSFRVSYLLL